MASVIGLPFSQVMSLARSSWFSTMSWYHLCNQRARWRAVVLRKEGKAAAAAVMAFSVSDLSNSGHVPIILPVEGSRNKAVSIVDCTSIEGAVYL